MAARPAVAKGGIFGAAQRPTYSKDTQELLKVMMEESRLTNFQRRKLRETMKEGQSLPVKVAPTSSEAKKRREEVKMKGKMKIPQNLRTLDRIERSGAYERDQFVPKPTKSLEKEKERLSNMMAYGEDIDMSQKTRKIRAPPTPEPMKDRFEEIQDEILERREFLNAMEKVGQGKKHRAMIETQISQLIREMEVIDRKRTAELVKALENQES